VGGSPRGVTIRSASLRRPRLDPVSFVSHRRCRNSVSGRLRWHFRIRHLSLYSTSSPWIGLTWASRDALPEGDEREEVILKVPRRYQRTRRKAARLPEGVVVVTRPTKWGNPYPLSLGREEAVRRYRDDLLAGRLPVDVDVARQELGGRDLACYCPLDKPCHADVLLEVANS
jgi:hypothetical protein